MASSNEHCIQRASERLITELGDPRTSRFGDLQSRGSLQGAGDTDYSNRDRPVLTNPRERVPWLDADGNVLR